MGFYYIAILTIALIGGIVQWLFRGKLSEFSKLTTFSGLSGKEVAERMLKENDIINVKVVDAEGEARNFYDSSKKIIILSSEVYHGHSLASIAIASHESGHAVQDSKGYMWTSLRNIAMPVISIISAIVPWIIFGGVLSFRIFPQILLVGIGLFVIAAIFCFITLPIELDASKRALKWMKNTKINEGKDQTLAKNALNWAAMAYLMNATSSLVMLLFYMITLIGGQHSDNA